MDDDLLERIARHESMPYIYNYPPTRIYESDPDFSFNRIDLTRDVNLYIHIPFCEQKCSFCGYLTVIDGDPDVRRRYVDALCQEIRLYGRYLRMSNIVTVNFGGGTPSLLKPYEIKKILDTIIEVQPLVPGAYAELSIEATPETVTLEKFTAYRKLGFDRVSVGIQTFDDKEIALVKRHNEALDSLRALETLRFIGFPNVCVDLMYGLPGQTVKSWYDTIAKVIAEQPDTIELYRTVRIPGTVLARRDEPVNAAEQIWCYQYAQSRLAQSGYEQECHLRFVRPGRGGYRQQENVYALQSLIGIGVGARSYTQAVHYRNAYDTRHPKAALLRYIDRIEAGGHAVESSADISLEEARRRYVIHQLEHLDPSDFRKRFRQDLAEVFPDEVSLLLDKGFWEESGDGKFVLALHMMPYRDLIAQTFFSPQVLLTEKKYYAADPSLVSIRKPS